MNEIGELGADVLDEVQLCYRAGLAYIQPDEEWSPLQIVAHLQERIVALKAAGTAVTEENIMGMGVLLGEQYVAAFDWHWGQVVRNGDVAHAGVFVLAADNSLAINPIGWINSVLTTPYEANFLLNFNMVAAQILPPATPNAAVVFH